MSDWPIDIEDDERIVRGVCSPYHVKKGKLLPGAFDPPPNENVSVMRLEWMGSDACRQKSLALEDTAAGKVYRGMAVLTAGQIRACNVDVLDSRDIYPGHADIHHGIIKPKGDPLPPEQLLKLNEQKKALAKAAAYYPDPDTTSVGWTGAKLEPKAS